MTRQRFQKTDGAIELDLKMLEIVIEQNQDQALPYLPPQDINANSFKKTAGQLAHQYVLEELGGYVNDDPALYLAL